MVYFIGFFEYLRKVLMTFLFEDPIEGTVNVSSFS